MLCILSIKTYIAEVYVDFRILSTLEYLPLRHSEHKATDFESLTFNCTYYSVPTLQTRIHHHFAEGIYRIVIPSHVSSQVCLLSIMVLEPMDINNMNAITHCGTFVLSFAL